MTMSMGDVSALSAIKPMAGNNDGWASDDGGDDGGDYYDGGDDFGGDDDFGG